MSPAPELRSERLVLRRWRAADRAPFAELNADPHVMRYFPAVLTVEQSNIVVDRFEAHFQQRGFGFWAVEAPGVAEFIGFVGLGVPGFEAPFTPCVEIGWRLAAAYWGRGYASEAARTALDFGFGVLGLREIVSFTVPANQRSRNVMRRLGFDHDPSDDFGHPSLPEGHPLRRHVLYRRKRP